MLRIADAETRRHGDGVADAMNHGRGRSDAVDVTLTV